MTDQTGNFPDYTFEYDESSEFWIAKEDSKIFVVDCSTNGQGGSHWVLHWRGKSIGFTTLDFMGKHNAIQEPEKGKYIWTIGNIGSRVFGSKLRPMAEAKVYQFCGLEELEQVKRIIVLFLERYDPYQTESNNSQKRGKILFSDHLNKRVNEGELF